MALKKILLKIGIDLLIIAAVAITAWLAVSFFQKKIIDISDKIQKKKIISYTLNHRDSNSAQISEMIGRLDPDWLAKVENGLPYIDDTQPFLDSVDSLGRKYGLTITLDLAAPEILPKIEGQLPIDRFAYKLTASDGNNNTLINFLRDFEQLRFFAGSQTLTVSAADDSGFNGKIIANLKGNLYVRERD